MSCTAPPVPGCIDSTACNYDPAANVSDGSCIYMGATPTQVNCWDVFTWNTSTCSWDTSGSQPVQPTLASCESATWDAVGCVWNVTSTTGTALTLTLSDQYNDGWDCSDGSVSTLTIDGQVYGATYLTGGPLAIPICLDLSICQDIIFTGANCWTSENAWSISDANGVIASGGYGTGNPVAGQQIGANCPVLGCMDSTAINYNPLANTNDSSCIYPLPCNDETLCDDFESGAFTTNNWLTSAASLAGVSLSVDALTSNTSVEFTGGATWYSYSMANQWSNTNGISAIEMCLDLSNVSSGPVSMSMDYDKNTYYGYGAFRVLVDGVAIANLDGNLEETGTVAKSLVYDLAAYAGSNVTVTLQGVAKYDSNYSSGSVGDFIYIDNVCVSTSSLEPLAPESSII